jgi:hypothetical protein
MATLSAQADADLPELFQALEVLHPDPDLQILSITGCRQLMRWPLAASAFRPLRLHTFIVTGTKLAELPDLSGCPQLERVILRDNHIGDIRRAHGCCLAAMCPWLPDSIRTVDLSYNKIHSVEDWGAAFPPTTVSVDVSFNFLKHAPPRCETTSFEYGHNDIVVRCSELYTRNAEGVWVNARSGVTEDEEARLRGAGRLSAHVREAPLDDEEAAPFVAWPPPHRHTLARPAAQAHPHPYLYNPMPAQVYTAARNPMPAQVYTGSQSVHATSVQTSATGSAQHILDAAKPFPVLSVAECVEQVRNALYVRRIWRFTVPRWAWPVRDPVSYALRDNTVHGTIRLTFGELLERVWAVVDHQPDCSRRAALLGRLREELDDGCGMCFTGRITRLVSVLQGFVDGVAIAVSPRERLQSRIAAIMARLRKNRGLKAELRLELEAVLDDGEAVLHLLEGEREAWLDAFEDA